MIAFLIALAIALGASPDQGLVTAIVAGLILSGMQADVRDVLLKAGEGGRDVATLHAANYQAALSLAAQLTPLAAQ